MVGRGQVGSNLGWSLVARAETCDQCHMNLKVNAKVESCTKIKALLTVVGIGQVGCVRWSHREP